MSVRRAIVASYASQAYVTLIGLVLVPVYLRYMGAENYGLVGFFLMLQGWFQLLDVGITPTISRETARYNGGAGSASELIQLVRVLQNAFFFIAVSTAVVFSLAAGAIAESWLKFQELNKADVVLALQLIGGLVSLRWACGLFRGIVTGFEKLVWLSWFNAGIATLRFVFVVPVLAYVGAGAKEFFLYQLAVAILELGVLIWKSNRLLPARSAGETNTRTWERLKQLSRFSLTIALTSALSIVVTQIDKLALSRLVSLNEFGYFTAASLLAGGVLIIAGPVGMVLQPRLASLAASGDERELIAFYRAVTQLVVALVAPAALVLAVFPEQVLWTWSGDEDFAGQAAAILALYAIGNGLMAFGALPFYLQFARGALRLHLIGSVLFASAFVPLCIWGAVARGAVGAGVALVVVAGLFFLTWVPRIHQSLAPGLHRRWLVEDVLPILLCALLAVASLRLLVSLSGDRLSLALQLAAIATATVLLAAAGSARAREKAGSFLRRLLEGRTLR